MENTKMENNEEKSMFDMMNDYAEHLKREACEKIFHIEGLGLTELTELALIFNPENTASCPPSVEINDAMTARMLLLIRESEQRIISRIELSEFILKTKIERLIDLMREK